MSAAPKRNGAAPPNPRSTLARLLGAVSRVLARAANKLTDRIGDGAYVEARTVEPTGEPSGGDTAESEKPPEASPPRD